MEQNWLFKKSKNNVNRFNNNDEEKNSTMT